MNYDIIVVGAGHGGIITAAKLSKEGYNVILFEKEKEGNISWDWGDNIDLNVFEEVNMPQPDPSQYFRTLNFTFISPNEEHRMTTTLSEDEREITIDRKILINHLLGYAHEAGVEIHYNTEIKEPILKDDVIIGVKNDEKEYYGNLIIDNAGVNTPIRYSLPQSYGISQPLQRGEKFYTYKAYFNQKGFNPHFQVYIGYKNKRGIAWVNTSDKKYADVLIGSIDPFEKGEINALLASLRKNHNEIGEKLLRGGIVAPIPIRRPANLLIGPNYVLIGDAAQMTIPINGSGIVNSMKAGFILANVIKNITTHKEELIKYFPSDLWSFQYEYIKEIGAQCAFIDAFKDFILTTPYKNVNFAFKKRLITEEDLQSATSDKDLQFSIGNLAGRIWRGLSKFRTLISLGANIMKSMKVKKHYEKIPKQYDEDAIIQWIEKAEKLFSDYNDKLQEGYGKLTFKGEKIE